MGIAGLFIGVPFESVHAITNFEPLDSAVLRGDIRPPWPLKVDKAALNGAEIVLGDGRAVPRFASAGELTARPNESGFALDRRWLYLRLPPGEDVGPQKTVRIRQLVKLKSSVFKSALGLAVVAFVWPRLQRAVQVARRVGRSGTLWVAFTGITIGGFIVLIMLRFANGADVWMALAAAVAAIGIGFERFFMAAQGAASRAREGARLSAISVCALLLCATLIEVYLELRGGAPEEAPEESHFFMLPPEVIARTHARTEPLTLPAGGIVRPKSKARLTPTIGTTRFTSKTLPDFAG